MGVYGIMKEENQDLLGPHGPPEDLPKTGLPVEIDQSIYTTNKKKLIDFILAFQPMEQTDIQTEYRQLFEMKLIEEGLELEYEGLDQSQDGRTCFIKIHAPWEILARTAEIARFKMAIQKSDMEEDEDCDGKQKADSPIQEFLCCGRTPFLIEENLRPAETPTYFTLEFSKEQSHLFLNKDSSTFFTQTQRILLTWEIMQRATISTDEVKSEKFLKGHKKGQQVGINYLIKQNVINAAFPLHDADPKINPDDPKQKPKDFWPMRPWLSETWARPGRWKCFQPLDQIRDYFGEKVAIYFAWLGIYTTLLIPLTLFGIFCFLWGIITLGSDKPSADVCDKDGIGGWIVCRSCQSISCPFKYLYQSCMFSKLNAVFHHNLTLILALVVSLWSVLFLEVWKREQARLACKWDTFDVGFEYEPPRPEYQAYAKERRRHPITREWEPYVGARSRIQNLVASMSAVTFLIALAISIITGVIIFKASMVITLYQMHLPIVSLLMEYVGSATVTSLVGSCINGISIVVLEKIYAVIAWWLTEKEYPRTMSDFEQSYTYKMYTFQFVNYYALLFYLAYVQPSVQAAVTPISIATFNDQCDPMGCAFFVTTQLIVILICKQAWNNVVEIFLPKLLHWWRTRKNIAASDDNVYTRYEKDFDLPAPPPLSLLPEYLEMVVQYGTVVLFGAAFPLSPLFALINNIIEIRIDAYKFVCEVRRVIPFRGKDIGTWHSIMEFVTRLGILTNAMMIAYTTDLIDRLVFKYFFSETGDMQGYVNFILGEFNTEDWHNDKLMYDDKIGNVTLCHYRGYYTDPSDTGGAYRISRSWWVVNLSKIAFVLIFQNVVLWTQEIIQYSIPDVPDDVALHNQRNRYISRMAAYKQDQEKYGKRDSAPQSPTFFSKSGGPDKADSIEKKDEVKEPDLNPEGEQYL